MVILKESGTRKREFLSIRVAGLVALVLLGLLAGPAQQVQRAAGSVPYRNITPAQLNVMLRQKDFTLINVHVPYAGEISRTDAFIPYTEVEAKLPRLLANKRAKIVVYCQTGRMSEIAADVLVRLGYTNVFNLQGGMVAWRQAGYPLLMHPR